jgi:hypothetical protein
MADITITHTHEAGTLVEGSRRGDGVWEVLKGLGTSWRYFRSLGQIGLGQSRDRAAKTWRIDQAAEALRKAGHTVTVEVDDSAESARSFAGAEAERYERAGDRADYHNGVARSAGAKSQAAYGGEHGILDMIPMGQPILVGHHSERRHRRDLERAESLRRRGRAEAERAEHHAGRAGTAERYQARRESVPATLRRIGKLEAAERGLLRDIEGGTRGQHPYTREVPPATGGQLERLTAELAGVREQLTYWRELVKAAQAAGVKVWSREDFTKGDYVRFLGTWFEVLRVSGKSVTIPAMLNDGPVVTRAAARLDWTDTVPYHKVTGRMSAADMAALVDEAARRVCEEAQVTG